MDCGRSGHLQHNQFGTRVAIGGDAVQPAVLPDMGVLRLAADGNTAIRPEHHVLSA